VSSSDSSVSPPYSTDKEFRGWVYNLRWQHNILLGVNLFDQGSRSEVAEFLWSRLDQTAFEVIYAYIYRYIEFKASFSIPILKYFLKQTFINIGVRLVNLIHLEVANNPGTTWKARKEGRRKWNIALDAHRDINKAFQNLALDNRFQGVELIRFTWHPMEQVTGRRRQVIEMEPVVDLFIDDEPPPPISQSGPLSGGTDYSNAGLFGAETPSAGHFGNGSSGTDLSLASPSPIDPSLAVPSLAVPSLDVPSLAVPHRADSFSATPFDTGSSVTSPPGADLFGIGPSVTRSSDAALLDSRRRSKRPRR